MGALVWAAMERRWLWVAGFVLAVGGAFLGSVGRVLLVVGVVLILTSIALNVTRARRRRVERLPQQGAPNR